MLAVDDNLKVEICMHSNCPDDLLDIFSHDDSVTVRAVANRFSKERLLIPCKYEYMAA